MTLRKSKRDEQTQQEYLPRCEHVSQGSCRQGS
jgi:hypothetical protein